MNTTRLQSGDLVRYGDKVCRVLRVSDCSAVIGIPQPERTITTLAGKSVTIIPHPKWVHISPNSEIEIINR